MISVGSWWMQVLPLRWLSSQFWYRRWTGKETKPLPTSLIRKGRTWVATSRVNPSLRVTPPELALSHHPIKRGTTNYRRRFWQAQLERRFFPHMTFNQGVICLLHRPFRSLVGQVAKSPNSKGSMLQSLPSSLRIDRLWLTQGHLQILPQSGKKRNTSRSPRSSPQTD